MPRAESESVSVNTLTSRVVLSGHFELCCNSFNWRNMEGVVLSCL